MNNNGFKFQIIKVSLSFHLIDSLQFILLMQERQSLYETKVNLSIKIL